MPGGDRTGPLGRGPRTGRGAGHCVGMSQPGFMNRTPGRGLGIRCGGGRGFGGARGFGGGRGWRHRFYATGRPVWMEFGLDDSPSKNLPSAVEADDLKNRAELLQSELNLIHSRLDEIYKNTTP